MFPLSKQSFNESLFVKKTLKAPKPRCWTQRGFAWKEAEQKWALVPAPRPAGGTVATMPQTGAEQELQSAPWICLEMEQQN